MYVDSHGAILVSKGIFGKDNFCKEQFLWRILPGKDTFCQEQFVWRIFPGKDRFSQEQLISGKDSFCKESFLWGILPGMARTVSVYNASSKGWFLERNYPFLLRRQPSVMYSSWIVTIFRRTLSKKTSSFTKKKVTKTSSETKVLSVIFPLQ